MNERHLAFSRLTASIGKLVMLLSAVCMPLSAQTSARIEVERLIIDAWITGADGTPLENVRPEDLRVTIAGEPARVDAVDAYGVDPEPLATRVEASSTQHRPQGRLLVFFFQTDVQRVRAGGQLRMMREARNMLEGLAPSDRVAVVSFDSHLKLLQDFTSDRELLDTAIGRSIAIGRTPEHTSNPRPSLSSHITRERARRAAKPEQALILLAKALMRIDGAKALVFFGWGLGRYGAGGVRHEPEWRVARQLLEDARTSIFVLDVSNADYHSLEVALKDAAESTGGFYRRTHVFPQQARSQLERTLSVRFEISVVIEGIPRGVHPVTVKLVGRPGQVLSRATWTLR